MAESYVYKNLTDPIYADTMEMLMESARRAYHSNPTKANSTRLWRVKRTYKAYKEKQKMNAQIIPMNESTQMAQVTWTKEQIEIIRSTVAKGATDAEIVHFFQVCKARGLNPFTKEVWFIKRGDTPTIQVSIDGLRLIAHRTGKLTGIKRGVEKRDNETYAWAEVYRSDWKFPAREEVALTEYKTLNNQLWNKMPNQMLKKAAESHALRMAFPESMSGLYTHEEMAQADDNGPVQPHEIQAASQALQEIDLNAQKEFNACVQQINALKKEYSLTAADAEWATGHKSLKGLPLDELKIAVENLEAHCQALRQQQIVEVPAIEMVTPEQIKKMATVITAKGITELDFRAFLQSHFKVQSRKDLTKAQAMTFIDWLEAQ